ncbi:glycine zipper 2TM domain-containing protein [Inhella sp.]|uniref:glycine zipper 2TM domain-containing protein n=1 Tax=Inhella sp. TaxID=1921806 RepID=UPI0035B0BC34
MSRLMLSLLVAATLTGCASTDPDLRSRPEAMQMARVQDGTLLAVRKVKLDGNQTGLGATVGSVAGGVAGSSVGGSRESVVFATLGAVLGGVIGHAIERSGGRDEALELIVQLRNGERVAIVQSQGDEVFKPGDAVMIITSGRSARVARALPPVAPEAAASAPAAAR